MSELKLKFKGAYNVCHIEKLDQQKVINFGYSTITIATHNIHLTDKTFKDAQISGMKHSMREDMDTLYTGFPWRANIVKASVSTGRRLAPGTPLLSWGTELYIDPINRKVYQRGRNWYMPIFDEDVVNCRGCWRKNISLRIAQGKLTIEVLDITKDFNKLQQVTVEEVHPQRNSMDNRAALKSYLERIPNLRIT